MSQRVWMTVAGATLLTLAACTFDFGRYRHVGAGGTSSTNVGGGGGTAGAGGGGAGGASGPGSVVWAYRLGGPALDLALAVGVNSDGEVISAGSFTGALELDSMNSFPAQGVRDLFLVKLSADGQLVWAVTHGGSGEIFVRDLAVDGFGNIIVVGAFSGGVDFGGGPRMSGGNATTDMFVVKYGPGGNWIWEIVAGDPLQDDALQAVDADASGSIVVAGSFSGAATFQGSPLVSAGGSDIVLAYIDPLGMTSLPQRYGDLSNNVVNDIRFLPNGDVFVVGTSQVGVDFGGGVLVGGPGGSITVAALGPAWEHRFSDVFSSNGTDQGLAASVDSSGSLAFAGASGGDIDFGGGAQTGFGQDDIFVVRLDGAGSHQWGDLFGDAMRQQARALVTDASQNLIVAGALEGSADFGAGQALSSQGLYDAFVAKLSPQGDAIFARAFGDADTQRAHALAVDAGGIYVAGEFEGQLVLDGATLISQAQLDGFVAKLRP